MSWTYVQQSRARERVWLALLLAGVVVPYGHAVPWLVDNGPDVGLFAEDLFATGISSFFAWDVVLAGCVLVVLALTSEDLTSRQRACVLGGSLAGASVGLPLYLWLRERNRSGAAAPCRGPSAARCAWVRPARPAEGDDAGSRSRRVHRTAVQKVEQSSH